MALGDAVVVCSTTFEGAKKTAEETLGTLAGVKYSYRTASNTQHSHFPLW